MLKTLEIDLEFAPVIAGPPLAPKQMFKQAASNDEITIDSWRETWIESVSKNHKARGPFIKNGIGKLFGRYKGRSAIIVGSGPSLRGNILDLVEASKHLPVISCLHNFHYLEDHGVRVDFYTTLDAGPITVEEVYTGGTKTPEEYWAITKDRKLLAFIGSNPELISKWQGEIYWFHCPIPDEGIMSRIREIEPFHTFVSTGGNVLGACLYATKALMAANPIVFVGADFSFSYNKKFHGWDSKYDASMGYAFKVPDIFGNKVYTWQSYYNFKYWFDYVATSVPGVYINASEGGCLGAYPEGNIQHVQQRSLKEVALMYGHTEQLREQCENPHMDISLEKRATLLF